MCFGGTVNDRPPIVAVDDDGDGVTDSYTYQGNGDHRQTTVSNGVEVDTNVAVSDFFGDSIGRAEHPDVAVERATGSVG